MSVNQIIISGNLGSDPEMGNGSKPSCRFSLAVNDSKDRTTWFNVRAYESQAETCTRYLNKGSSVIVVGRMTSYEFTDREGNNRKAWEVVANRVHFNGPSMKDSRSDNSQASQQGSNQGNWGSQNSWANQQTNQNNGHQPDTWGNSSSNSNPIPF